MFRFLLVLLPVSLSAFPLPFDNPIQTHVPVIDPVLGYATYAGGSGKETGKAIAVDVAGNAYLAGNTDSPNFPHSRRASSGQRGFVGRLDASGSNFTWLAGIGAPGSTVWRWTRVATRW